MTVDVIQRGEALAIFERDLIIHFQQISRAAALYIRALLGESNERLKSTEEWTKQPKTFLGPFRPLKKNGTHMRKVS